MDRNTPMTKKEMKALRKLERLDQSKNESSQNKMKWIILTIGSVIFIGAFLFIIAMVKQEKSEPVAMETEGRMRGSASASATLTEFGDFQCPACKAYEPIVRNLLVEFGEDLKLEFKHFPLVSIHPNALLSAKAAEAAGIQGKFWEMHDFLYDEQDAWAAIPAADARAKFVEKATELGLDIEKFNQDIDSEAVASKVSAMQSEGINLGVNGTPTFFLNNKRLDTPRDYESFKQLIQAELSK